MLQTSLGEVVASCNQDDRCHHRSSSSSNNNNESNNTNDDDSGHPKSVNLLHNQNKDDDHKSIESEETELPSQNNNMTFGLSRTIQPGGSLRTNRDRSLVLRQVNMKPTVAKNTVDWLSASSLSSSSPSSIAGLQNTPPSNPPIAKAPTGTNNDNNTMHVSLRTPSISVISKTVSRVLPLQSPTTEALKELSQDMDKLQYPKNIRKTDPNKTTKKDTRKKQNELEKNHKNKTASNEDTAESPLQPQPMRQEQNPKQNEHAVSNASMERIAKFQYDLPPDIFNEWNIVAIPFPKTEKASLGISILRDTFPGLNQQPSKRHCVISRIIMRTQNGPDYCSAKYGLKAGDWFLTPGQDYTLPLLAPPTLADFDQISQWSKQKPYRMICILRKTKETTKNPASISHGTKPIILSAEKASSPPAKGYKRRKIPSKPTKGSKKQKGPANPSPVQAKALAKKSSVPPPKSSAGQAILDGLLVPFCNRCTAERDNKTPKSGIHHMWCPKNHFFHNSGAEDILLRIVHGRKIGCQACEKEFQAGKPLLKIQMQHDGASGEILCHNIACLKNQECLNHNQEERKLQPGKSHGKVREKTVNGAAKRNQMRPQPSTKKKRNNDSSVDPGRRRALTLYKGNSSSEKGCKHALVETASLSSSCSEDDFQNEDSDDLSVYRPTQKKRKIQTLSLRKTNKQQQWKGKPAASKASTQKSAVEILESQNSDKLRESSQSLQQSRPVVSCTATDFIGRYWTALEDDPWGPEGHVVGDVVLHGPARGQGHFETLLPSNRYRFDPFESGSLYRNTHYLPEEGFSLILIKRDTLGKTPWGFHVGRDEFGHACLITSVESSSPTSAATWIGASTVNCCSASLLHVNDMLVMVNGKPVGGMSEVGLSLELELSAPDLYLGVSRYKMAHNVRRAMMSLERQALIEVDAASRDLRLIGWQEIGNGTANEILVLDSDQNDIGPEQSLDIMTIEDATQLDVKENNENGHVDSSCYGKYSSLDLAPSSPKTRSLSAPSSEIKETRNKSFTAQEQVSPTGVQPTSTNSSLNNYDGHCDVLSMGGDVETHGSKDDPNDDSNPWLGCVCGEIHSSEMFNDVKMFWIQCESCNAWYDVAEQCIGFTEAEAESKDWKCEACVPYESEEERGEWTENDRKSPGEDVSAFYIVKDKESTVNRSRTLVAPPIPKNESPKQTRGSTSELLNVATSLTEMGNEDPPNSETKEDKGSGGKYKNAEKETRHSGQCLNQRWETFQRWEGPCVKPVGNSQRNKCRGNERGNESPTKQSFNRKNDEIYLTSKERHKEAENPKPSERSRLLNQNASSEKMTEACTPQQAGKRTKLENSEPSQSTNTMHTFEKGELVMLEKHSWPGVDNEEGVGRIVGIKVDEDGDKRYDVKYVCAGSTAREVYEEYIKPYKVFTQQRGGRQ
jgi:hypothetical protein